MLRMIRRDMHQDSHVQLEIFSTLHKPEEMQVNVLGTLLHTVAWVI